MKKLSSIFLVLFLVLLLGLVLGSGSFAAETVKYTEQAEVLKSLGLFNGTNVGFELERAPKRVEVAAMLVKFLGAEEEAKAKQYKHPFTDVPAWANHIVGYMYEKKLTTGIGNNLFGSLNPASAKDYTVFLLKALGYGSADFTYNETMNFAVSKGLYTAAEKATLESTTFKRDEMVFSSYKSLFTKVKGSTQLLSEKLGIASVPKIVAPVTATVQEVVEIKTGVKVGTDGIITINRSELPTIIKDYTKVSVAEMPLGSVDIIKSYSDSITSKSTTKFYTTASIDAVTACKYLNDKVTLLFYNSNNKLIGYSNLETTNIIIAMKSYLESKGIMEITKGVVVAAYEDGVFANINMGEIDYENPQNLKKYIVGIIQNGLSVVAIVKDSINYSSPYLVPVSAGGVSTGKVLTGDNVLIQYYDSNNKLIAYSICAYSELNKRTDAIKEVEVIFESKFNNGFSNSFFTIEYYKNDVLVGSQGVRYFDLIINEKGEWIGARFKPVIIDPNGGFEIKVKSDNPNFVIKSTQVK